MSGIRHTNVADRPTNRQNSHSTLAFIYNASRTKIMLMLMMSIGEARIFAAGDELYSCQHCDDLFSHRPPLQYFTLKHP